MAFMKLAFRPGVSRDQTDYAGEGGWYACNRIRFLSGQPQSIGGWAKVTPAAFRGVSRGIHNWITTFQDNLLAVGTNSKLYIEAGGNVFDISPIADTLATPDTDNSISTTIGSNVVTVSLPVSHGAITGTFVTIAGAVSVGGIPASEINGNHQVEELSATSFAYYVTTPATSTEVAGGGAAITMEFEINPGLSIATAGYGWGTGTWGRDFWGLGSASGPIILSQRDWFYDNFDNDLIANIRQGPVYIWERGSVELPDTALATRAYPLAYFALANGYDPGAVPSKVMQIMVSQQDRHLIAFGCTPFGSTDDADFDPMLIRWSDQDNFGQWTPEVTNSAGFIRVSRGSKIVRGLPTRQEILVFTDSNLYTLQFLGTTDVFGLQQYAEHISIISPRAVETASNVTYWMGQDKFFAYTGRVETLPCTLRDHVFEDLNINQAAQVVCGVSEHDNEVWWFYPSKSSDFNNKYVIYNHLERIWYYGDIERTAWLDSALRPYPQAMAAVYTPITLPSDTGEMLAATSYLYNHEVGTDADGAPLNSFLQSNDFDLGEGDQFMLTRRIIPDFSFSRSTVENPQLDLEIRPRRFPGSPTEFSGEDGGTVIKTSVDTFTEQVFVRARGRQIALKISTNTLGSAWQLGACRLDVRPDGSR